MNELCSPTSFMVLTMSKNTVDLFFAQDASMLRGKPCRSRMSTTSATNSLSPGSIPKLASHNTSVCTRCLANSSTSARSRSRENARTFCPTAPPQ